jgi:hypothetical protein
MTKRERGDIVYSVVATLTVFVLSRNDFFGVKSGDAKIVQPGLRAPCSKIISKKIVRSPTVPNILFDRSRNYQITVCVKGAQKARFIRSGIRLKFDQCIFVDKERCLDSTVITPKSHCTPRSIVRSAMVWEINHVAYRLPTLSAKRGVI